MGPGPGADESPPARWLSGGRDSAKPSRGTGGRQLSPAVHKSDTTRLKGPCGVFVFGSSRGAQSSPAASTSPVLPAVLRVPRGVQRPPAALRVPGHGGHGLQIAKILASDVGNAWCSSKRRYVCVPELFN